LLLSVGRPDRFLAAVGRRVTVRRLNRYALALRWRVDGEFNADVAAREYEWFGFRLNLGSQPEPPVARLRQARWWLVVRWMRFRRARLHVYRTDPSEVLFDAAAAGLRNGNMRTWRGALDVIGRQLQSQSLQPAAAEHLVANAQVLEEIAHRQGSEDCKVRLCTALGLVGSVKMSEESSTMIAKGISTLAERRLHEHRPVLAAVAGLETLAASNPLAAVRTIGWLGQHLASVPPPVAVYGFDGDRAEHPTRALFALLADLAERADRDGDAELNDAIIDAGSMIAQALPGSQDRETIDTLGSALSRAGVAAARRYGDGAPWHRTSDAARALARLHHVNREAQGGDESSSTSEWIAEAIARMGCWVVSNRTSVAFGLRDGRSDMAALIADRLLQLPPAEVERAFVELIVGQHNSEIPRERREQFIGLCQQITGQLLGLGKVLSIPEGTSGTE
jgi:hypothetical protein